MRTLAVAIASLILGLPGTPGEPPIELFRQTIFLMGHMTIHEADGKDAGHQEVLLKRTQDPRKKRLEEEVVLQRPGELPELHRVVMTVNPEAATFQLADEAGLFTGHGTLTGRPWRWGKWQTIMEFKDGARIVWNNVLDGPGMTADGTLYDPEGQPRVRFKEDLKLVNQDVFERRRHEILPDPKSSFSR